MSTRFEATGTTRGGQMSLFLAVLTDRNSKSLKLHVRTDEIDPSCISVISFRDVVSKFG